MVDIVNVFADLYSYSDSSYNSGALSYYINSADPYRAYFKVIATSIDVTVQSAEIYGVTIRSGFGGSKVLWANGITISGSQFGIQAYQNTFSFLVNSEFSVPQDQSDIVTIEAAVLVTYVGNTKKRVSLQVAKQTTTSAESSIQLNVVNSSLLVIPGLMTLFVIVLQYFIQ